MDKATPLALLLALLGFDAPRLAWMDPALIGDRMRAAGAGIETGLEHWMCRTAPWSLAVAMPSRCADSVVRASTGGPPGLGGTECAAARRGMPPACAGAARPAR